MSEPTIDKLLEEIQRYARQITSHRHECEQWTGYGCEISMYHDAEDILELVDQLGGRITRLNTERHRAEQRS